MNDIETIHKISLLDNNYKISFIIKIIIASLIAAISLSTNNQEGIIGSMLVSPIGSIIMGVAASIVVLDLEAGISSIKYLIISIFLILIISYLIGTQFKNEPISDEMQKRSDPPTKWDFILAFIVGLIFGIVYRYGDNIPELVGSAIAISLLPPIVNIGLLYTKDDKYIKDKNTKIKNCTKLVMYNIFGVFIACFLIFLIRTKIPSII